MSAWRDDDEGEEPNVGRQQQERSPAAVRGTACETATARSGFGHLPVSPAFVSVVLRRSAHPARTLCFQYCRSLVNSSFLCILETVVDAPNIFKLLPDFHCRSISAGRTRHPPFPPLDTGESAGSVHRLEITARVLSCLRAGSNLCRISLNVSAYEPWLKIQRSSSPPRGSTHRSLQPTHSAEHNGRLVTPHRLGLAWLCASLVLLYLCTGPLPADSISSASLRSSFERRYS